MKKTVSVNIKGLNFLIEEDAYELLHQYMDRLNHALRNDKGKNEIIEDIELRVAELCSSKLNERKQVIELDDIRSILETLGDPSLYIDEEATENNSTKQSNIPNDKTVSEKRLFRDTDNASIAGVCAGISNYFNIDVVIIRAIFLVIFLFGGFGFPLYVILWIVVPKANSTIDKLRMRGKPITVESVRVEVETAAERIKNESKSFANRMRNDENVGRRFSVLGKFITGAMGIAFICLGLLLLVLFLVTGIGGIQFIPAQSETGFLSISQLSELVLRNSSDYRLAWWGVIIAGTSGILFVLLLGAKLLFRIRNKWSRITLSLLFTAGFVGTFICIPVGLKTAREMAIEGEIEREVGSVNVAELEIVTNAATFQFSPEFKIKSEGKYGMIGLKENKIVQGGIHLTFKQSKDSVYHIYQNLSAHSFSHQNALIKAKHIEHSIYIAANKLHINSSYSYPKKDKLRDQEVCVIIEIPDGKFVKIGGTRVPSFENEKVADETKLYYDKDKFYYNEDGFLQGDGSYIP